MSEELINVKTVLSSLNGSVHSQGVKVNERAWLDMGSKDWAETPDAVKAAAFQAAKVTGWTEESIKDIMMECYPHIKEFLIDQTLETLRDLEQQFPCEVETVYEPDCSITLAKGGSCPESSE